MELPNLKDDLIYFTKCDIFTPDNISKIMSSKLLYISILTISVILSYHYNIRLITLNNFMTKHKSEDYKLSAVKYFLENKDKQ